MNGDYLSRLNIRMENAAVGVQYDTSIRVLYIPVAEKEGER